MKRVLRPHRQEHKLLVRLLSRQMIPQTLRLRNLCHHFQLGLRALGDCLRLRAIMRRGLFARCVFFPLRVRVISPCAYYSPLSLLRRHKGQIPASRKRAPR